MPSREAKIAAAEGLHARPAGEFVKAAKSYEFDIKISHGDKTVSAKSILSVLGLGAKQGDVVTLESGEPEADQALAALVELLETGE